MKIPKLKPNSPEFDDGSDDVEKVQQEKRCCDHPGCIGEGIFKAPKSSEKLNEFLWFCMPHIQEYNSKWNYFNGWQQPDIEEQIKRDMTWDRPTWKFGVHPFFEDRLRKKIYEEFRMDGEDGGSQTYSRYEEKKQREENFESSHAIPEMNALDVLGLEPPIDLGDIKKRYKELAKKYHPDLNNGNSEAEEKLKKINAAYTVLKIAYTRFEDIDLNNNKGY